MRPPAALPVTPPPTSAGAERQPRALPADAVSVTPFEPDPEPALEAPRPGFRFGRAGRLVIWSLGTLVSLALGLAADRLIRDLFAANPWLGWLGVGVLAVLLVGLFALAWREVGALARLRNLDALRARGAEVLLTDHKEDGRALLAGLGVVYGHRPDLAAENKALARETAELFDGAEMVRQAERHLLAPLDARARALTAASARRVALVTAVSPRALVDIGYVLFESFRLGGAIARLYGARPGFFGSWRILGAVLAHLVVTGGLLLTDGAVEQLVGQGLAAKLSARLGEGVVNGLMTARVGIAAARALRPLPYTVSPAPAVRDFIPELVNVVEFARSGP
jgi:putative membrane protein